MPYRGLSGERLLYRHTITKQRGRGVPRKTDVDSIAAHRVPVLFLKIG